MVNFSKSLIYSSVTLEVISYCFVATPELEVVGNSGYFCLLFLSILRFFEVLVQDLLFYLLDCDGSSLKLFCSSHESQHFFAVISEDKMFFDSFFSS